MKNKIKAALAIAALTTAGLFGVSAPAAATPGNYVYNYGSKTFIVTLDSGVNRILYPGQGASSVRGISVQANTCVIVYQTNGQYCSRFVTLYGGRWDAYRSR